MVHPLQRTIMKSLRIIKTNNFQDNVETEKEYVWWNKRGNKQITKWWKHCEIDTYIYVYIIYLRWAKLGRKYAKVEMVVILEQWDDVWLVKFLKCYFITVSLIKQINLFQMSPSARCQTRWWKVKSAIRQHCASLAQHQTSGKSEWAKWLNFSCFTEDFGEWGGQISLNSWRASWRNWLR